MTTHVIEPMPPTKPTRSELEDQLAWGLVAIERNYCSEGTNWGSRFEGERLEVVQARWVMRELRRVWELPNGPAGSAHIEWAVEP